MNPIRHWKLWRRRCTTCGQRWTTPGCCPRDAWPILSQVVEAAHVALRGQP